MKFNFNLKLYFFNFLVSNLRDKKERANSSNKKSWLKLILVTKTSDFGFSEIFL
jgi:hypothetical protein